MAFVDAVIWVARSILICRHAGDSRPDLKFGVSHMSFMITPQYGLDEVGPHSSLSAHLSDGTN